MSVAGCELGDELSIALGVEECHGALREVTTFARLPLVVDVGDDELVSQYLAQLKAASTTRRTSPSKASPARPLGAPSAPAR